MSIMDAWNACPHGGTISRPGRSIEKWMGEKPGLASSFERWLAESVGEIPAVELMAGDWTVGQA
jgi:hypothetical protein